MNTFGSTVYVTGAGFSKSYLSNSPLITDYYATDDLRRQFANFPAASRVLTEEIAQNENDHINIERLMTRLDSLMPYDMENASDGQLTLLGGALRRVLLERLRTAIASYQLAQPEVVAFAEHCISSKSSCLTFNYDDLLDRALFQASEKYGSPGWDPDTGYGFLCKGVSSLLGGNVYASNVPPMHLLKLHGSVNWRPRLGSSRPYSVDSMCHAEDWNDQADEVLDLHLEREPFIVPPVMQKGALVHEPVLRFIWTLAFNVLNSARRIVFLGYSLPATDLAARFLFKEAVQRPIQVMAVNLDGRKSAFKENFREVFPAMGDKDFISRDVSAWARDEFDIRRTARTT